MTCLLHFQKSVSSAGVTVAIRTEEELKKEFPNFNRFAYYVSVCVSGEGEVRVPGGPVSKEPKSFCFQAPRVGYVFKIILKDVLEVGVSAQSWRAAIFAILWGGSQHLGMVFQQKLSGRGAILFNFTVA